MSIVDKLRSSQNLNTTEALLLCSVLSGLSNDACKLMFGENFSKDVLCLKLKEGAPLAGVTGLLSIYAIDKYSVDILGAAIRNVTPTKYSTSASVAALAIGLIVSVDPDGDMMGLSGTIRELAMTYGSHEAWEQYARLYADGANNSTDKLMVQFLLGSIATVYVARGGAIGEGLAEFIPDTFGNVTQGLIDAGSSLVGGSSPSSALVTEQQALDMAGFLLGD